MCSRSRVVSRSIFMISSSFFSSLRRMGKGKPGRNKTRRSRKYKCRRGDIKRTATAAVILVETPKKKKKRERIRQRRKEMWGNVRRPLERETSFFTPSSSSSSFYVEEGEEGGDVNQASCQATTTKTLLPPTENPEREILEKYRTTATTHCHQSRMVLRPSHWRKRNGDIES